MNPAIAYNSTVLISCIQKKGVCHTAGESWSSCGDGGNSDNAFFEEQLFVVD